MLDLKKQMTSLVVRLKDSASNKPRIHKISDEGKITSVNLNRPTYCRICEGVLMNYSCAFRHISQLLCTILTGKYAIPCPICQKVFRDYSKFYGHVMQQHDSEFLQKLKLIPCPPEMMSARHHKDGSIDKAITILWMIQLFKTIVDVDGASSKPFLPAIGFSHLGRNTDCTKYTLCRWPICVTINPMNYFHQHGYETDLDGICRFCQNYHHSNLAQSFRDRVCSKCHFQGNLE